MENEDKYSSMQNAVIKARETNQCVNLSAELTPMCNFNCPMCYIKQRTQPDNILNTEDWIPVLNEAIAAGVKYVLLTGGEVLAYKGFYDIAKFLCSKGVDVRIKTNGYFIDRTFLDFIDKNYIYMCDISIYGFDRESYLQNTGIDCFDIIRQNIYDLIHSGKTKVRLMLTNSKNNTDSAALLMRFVKQFGCDVIVNETPLFPPRQELDRQYETFFVGYSDTMKFKEVYCEEFSAEFSCKKRDTNIVIPCRGLSCSAGRSSCAIHWDGTVAPCLNYPYNKDNHVRAGFVEAFSTLQNVVSTYSRPQQCFECAVRDICNYCPAYSDSSQQPYSIFCDFWRAADEIEV